VKQWVDRWPELVLAWANEHQHLFVFQEQVPVGWSHVNLSGFKHLLVPRYFIAEFGVLVQPDPQEKVWKNRCLSAVQ
jgi:hypothetical protein